MPAEKDDSLQPGSKIGPWAFGTILVVSGALMAFGLSEDKMSKVRDAYIEISLLLRGPRNDFQKYCRESIEGLAPKYHSSLQKEFSKLAKELNLKLADDYSYRPVFQCPFPKPNEKVGQAIAFILEPHPPNAIYVHTNFINELAAELDRLAKGGKEEEYVFNTPPSVHNSLMHFASNLFKQPDAAISEFSVYSYQNEDEKRPRPFGNCAFHNHIFERDEPRTLQNLRIAVQGGGGIGCFEFAEDEGKKYLRGVVAKEVYFLRGYFASRILLEPSYSRPEAADTRPRNWRFDENPNDDAHGDYGNDLNEPGGFDFPALTARIYDLGDLSIEDAARKLYAEYDDPRIYWEIFDVKLPGVIFIFVSLVTLLMSYAMLVWASSRAGVLALSDAMRDMPRKLAFATLVAGVAVFPAMGFFAAAERIRYAMNPLYQPITILGYAWLLLASVVAIRWIIPSMSRQVMTKVISKEENRADSNVIRN